MVLETHKIEQTYTTQPTDAPAEVMIERLGVEIADKIEPEAHNVSDEITGHTNFGDRGYSYRVEITGGEQNEGFLVELEIELTKGEYDGRINELYQNIDLAFDDVFRIQERVV